MERNSISSTENPQGLYRWPAIDFPRELLKVFCAQISLQSVYLMTPSNGVVEGEGAQIRLWPIGRQQGSYPETGFEEIGARTALRTTAFPPSGLLARDKFRLARDTSAVGNGKQRGKER
jgi:hypothetical protein